MVTCSRVCFPFVHLAVRLTLPAAAVMLLAGAAVAQGTFTPLGELPGGYWATGMGISNDGAVVVGASDTLNPTQADGGWVWRRGTGFRFLPWRAQDVTTGAFSVSGDGSRIVGVSNDPYEPTAVAAAWNSCPATSFGFMPPARAWTWKM